MSNAAAVQNVEWKQLVAGATDSAHPETSADGAGRPEQSDTDFRFLYGVPEEMDLRVSFVPFYGQTEAEAPLGGRKTGQGDDEEESPDEILRRSYNEGFAKGETEGFETGRQKADPVVERLQTILGEIDGLWHQLVDTYEEKIIQLVARVSEKVVLGKVAVDHDTVTRVILDAFRLIPEPIEVTIEIHPEDVGHIENIKETFFKQIKSLKHVSILPNPSISPGGCRVKTGLGEVDATLESRLDAIRQTVEQVYRNKGGGGSDA